MAIKKQEIIRPAANPTVTVEDKLKSIVNSPTSELYGGASYTQNGVRKTVTPTYYTSGGTSNGGTTANNNDPYKNRDISQEILDAAELGRFGRDIYGADSVEALRDELTKKVAMQGGNYGGGTVQDFMKGIYQQYSKEANRGLERQNMLNMINNAFGGNNSTYDELYQSLLKKYNDYDFDTFKNGSAYQGLKSLYEMSGQNAMKDTLGEIAARTGGYASSYATAAAQEQYQNYMERLASLAEQMFQNEKGDMLSDLKMVGDKADTEKSINEQNRINRYNALMQLYNNDKQERLAEQQAQAQAEQTARNGMKNAILAALNSRAISTADITDEMWEQSGLSYLEALAAEQGAANEYEQQQFENSIKQGNLDINRSKAEASIWKTYNTGRGGSGSRRSSGGGGGNDTPKGTDDAGKWSAVDDWASTYSYYDKDKKGNKVYHDAGEDYVKEHYKDLGYSSQSAALSGYKNHKNESALENAEIGNRYDGGGVYVMGYGYISSDELIELLEEGKINQKYDKTTNKVYYSKR